MEKETMRELLERLGQALSAGDLRATSSCWAVPAVFLSDEGATVLADADEIEKLFARATEWYRSRGLVSTRPELEGVDVLSEKLAAVDVRWPAFDASGQEKWSERSHYILQVANDGQLRVRVALTRTA
jgi:hypothetical protein